MDITTHNRIEQSLEIDDHLYSLKMPFGVPIDEALEACGFFAAALTKMKKEKEEEKEEEKEPSSIGEKPS